MTLDELLQDPEVREWFDERPENVKEVIRQCPPCVMYVRSEEDDSAHYRFLLESYDEEQDGSITITAAKFYTPDFPMPSIRVFGIKPKDIKPASKVEVIEF